MPGIAENVIVFGGSAALLQVPAEGGVATPVTVLDASRGDNGHPGPWFLPDGRHLLYFRNSSMPETRGIYLASLDVKPDAQSLARVVASASRPIYAAAGVGPGHLLFLREQTLFAQPFDPEARRLTGEAFVVAEQVGLEVGIALGAVSATPEGTLAYRGAVGTSGTPIWVNRAGVEVLTIGAEIREPRNPRLSPDGKRLVLMASGDLWEYDLHGRPPVKLTAEGGVASPLWTPDGKSIVYEPSNATSLRIIAAAAGATPQPASPNGHYHPFGWSHDRRDLIAAQNTDRRRGPTSSGSRPASHRSRSSLSGHRQEKESAARRYRRTAGGSRTSPTRRDHPKCGCRRSRGPGARFAFHRAAALNPYGRGTAASFTISRVAS